MGIFDKQTQEAMAQWGENLTLEQIEEYEKQGLDMSEYRLQYEARTAAQKKETERAIGSLALDKLEAYKKARTAEDNFVADVIKFNGMKEKEKASLELAPLVYGKVVQAHGELYKPASDEYARGIVFLFALDDAHRYDEDWLAQTADRIMEMKDDEGEGLTGFWKTVVNLFGMENNFIVSSIVKSKQLKALPEDCRKFIGELRDDSSYFCFKLGETLSGGADAWCATYTLEKASRLPNSSIPYNRIIPFLLSEQPQADQFIQVKLIPPSYYTKEI